jgi:DNA-binding NarL/FixJ family response regulator
MEAPGANALAEGVRALEGADWAAARAAFESALAAGPSGDARAGLGEALWMLGHVAEGIEARAQAFEEYAREGRFDDAARVAVWVSHQHLTAGRKSAARGWLARCERELEGKGDCVGRGWVAVEHARQADNVHEQIEHAQRAMEIGRACGTGDLEVYALSLLGRATVSSGNREAGMRLLEEAMAAATAGRARDVHTLGEAYCNLVVACTYAGDWERATEWCEHVEQFAHTYATAPLFAACRTVHADVLLATGRWHEAEDALQGALATHARYVPEMAAPTVATLAELRVRQGRLGEAERLLAGREEHPSSLRALALLRIAEDRPRVAVALLERGLRATEGDAIGEAQLLAPLVDAQLARGDTERAAAAADALARLAELSGIRLVAARADLAAARVAVVGGARAEAAEAARRALAAYTALLMPLDAGEARLVLARALAADAPEVAADEARTAFAAFRELGATRAMDVAAALLRELGGATGGRARTAGELTAREQQVLELVSLGMSNARIAESLVISEKTAGHHVSRILTKLGVHNRTEAAAYARAAASAEAPAR